MRQYATPVALLGWYAVTVSAGALNPRQSGNNQVCKPEGLSNPVPPCVSVENIEWQCTPNGTEPLAFEAHKQCMCGGSFFSDWMGCESCLQAAGERSDRDIARYASVISAASSSLCGSGTLTKSYKEIFSSVDGTVPPVTTGATRSSDRLSGSTQVSNYFTATGTQGPGPISGSATAATSRPAETETRGTTSSSRTTATTGGSSSSPSPGSQSNTANGNEPATTSSSTGLGAAPTAAMGGMALGLAAGALAAVL
ncbi:hypothetical protein MGG_12858 [Pyricularia oryzae 70-15]|uniref:Uncharacterized protein n=5 Tax=Pyricularia TaxID=48558 RepID=A0ABQ8NVQ0_PYRGI|nr:uncharacterized protein MGG_12858 [Pyricularia oryzae 70-15]ELQ37977.1 hypothetical protein OOU_Y34scaffold00559g5 [Pyricularia oryzae Y34]KAI6279621.1 hypothetical protein MCOR26_004096 [Pyricularia oryzae]KAI6302818.1 hypothetical protein MCOR33_001903 [Pyricularia grisea]EHA50941.1 hypothetical protein MGG_12858 [Pyricularia oryzae 70-15]KAI6331730.1 hypothetical protein MCOR28_011211 [Pyricularia oryzae]